MNYETSVVGDIPTEDFEEDAERRRKRRIVAIAAGVGVVALIAAALLLHKGDAPATDAAAGATAPVVTVIVPGKPSTENMVNVTGSIAARVEMPVASVGEGGQVLRVLVQPGDRVGAGQTLAIIERSVQTEQIRSLAAQVEVARADAKLAQAELERAQALVGRGFISKADIDRRTATRDAADARVNVAVAQLGEQRARTGRLDIRAPAAGVVLTRTVEPGQVVAAGTGVLFRMAKDGQMEMLAQVSEGDMAGLKVGNIAKVTPVGQSRAFDGRIWQLSPVVDPQTRQAVARIALQADPAIRPGGFASASIVSGTGNLPLLPESAVQNDAKGAYVFTIDGKNQAERRDVKIGQVSSKGVTIVSGLSGNERVVASAGAFLNPGQKVKPVLLKPAS